MLPLFETGLKLIWWFGCLLVLKLEAFQLHAWFWEIAKSQMGPCLANQDACRTTGIPFFAIEVHNQLWQMCRCIVMMQCKTLRLPQIRSLAMNCIMKTLENFQVVQFYDGLSFWSIFVVHYSSAVKKDSQHYLGIGSHLSCLFGSWRLWMFSLETELSFQGRTRTLSFHLQLSQCSGIRDCHL